MKCSSITRGVIGAALLAIVAPSYAALISCPGSFTTDGTAKVHDGLIDPLNLTAASACQYISPPDNNNVANEANVNAAAFFGFSDWDVLATASQVSVEALSGSWSIAGADFLTNDYMIVFKDGQGTNLIGFQFNEEYASGLWDSPFANPPFGDLNAGQIKEVSHYSIFSRTSDTPPPPPPGQIPEPGSLALLGLGLAGLALYRRRRTA